MVLQSLFPGMFPPKDSEPAKSRNATLYLMRFVFYMGIRWPPKNYFVIYVLWSFVLKLLSIFYQPIGFVLGFISHFSEYSAADFLTSIQVTFSVFSCSIKVIIVWILHKRFDQANLILDELDKRVTQPTERRRIHKAVTSSNRVFFLFMTLYNMYATVTFMGAVSLGRPPYQNYYPFLDWRASSGKFWLQSGLEYFAMMGACFQHVCVDCYPINFMLPLRAHMAIFTDRLRRLGEDPNETPEQSYEKLIDCIQDHKVILRLCDTLRPVISGTIFVQLLLVGLVLGLTIINCVLFANFASSVANFTYMTAVLMEATPFCILCNYLTYDCYDQSDALFHSNWIDKEQRYKKTVLQFLQSLQKPIVFMAGNVFTISVATNIVATKFSFSVFTLVKEMNIVEKLSQANANA